MTTSMDIKRTMKEYYEQLYAPNLDMLGEIHWFHEM